jgi:hypothetical protein
METFLDNLWIAIVTGFAILGDLAFSVSSRFHFLGPVVLIAGLAALTVLLTKTLNRIIITRRFVALEKKYLHWMEVRNQAMLLEDREKGGRLARNIDQAELNQAYYDYFFEGLLLGMARKVIPIFFIFGFINEYYQQQHLVEYFGRDHVLTLINTAGQPLPVGAGFWYIFSLLCCYLMWSITGRIIIRYRPSAFKEIRLPA